MLKNNETLNSNNDSRVILVRASDVETTTDTDFMQTVLKEKGFGDGKDLAYFAINHSARRTIPYGIWTCKDGREVVFNREYQPIVQKKDGVLSYADRNEWVDNIAKVQYLYDDESSPHRYLTKHLGRDSLTAEQAKRCKKTLLICLQVLREYTPKEHGSVHGPYSVAKKV